MSALAQFIELRGIPTTIVGSIRMHMEKIEPPRGVFAPFQLGRPIGEPEDVAFQRRVLMQALRLLERADGPVILEDFPDDPPGWFDTPGWRPPFNLPPKAQPSSPDEWEKAFAAELALVRPYWENAKARFGRTTVGLSAQPPQAWPQFTAAFLRGELLEGPRPYMSPTLALRYMVDDIKAVYTEAAQSAGPAPASRQVDAWFWGETVAGGLLRALRTMAMASENNALKTVGSRYFVPTPFVEP